MKRLLLECEAARILMSFRGGLEPMSISHTAGGWRCTVTIEPVPGSIPIVRADDIPTACEAAILALLADGQRRLRPAIVRALEPDHAESTVVKALARLVRAGRITNVSRRGYAIAEVGTS